LIAIAPPLFSGVELRHGRGFVSPQDCGGAFAVHKIERVAVKSVVAGEHSDTNLLRVTRKRKKVERGGGPRGVKHECDRFVDTGGRALQEVREV
jgi:hypothetical protein